MRRDATLVLGGLKPERILRARRIAVRDPSCHIHHALQPKSPGVYNRYFIYSRFASGASLSEAPQAVNPPAVVLIRTDLTVPVMMFETEADVAVLGYVSARQPPTKYIREWEVAGRPTTTPTVSWSP